MLPGCEKLYAAGGPEDKCIQERKKNGIPLDEEVIQSLKDLSEELKITFDIDF